MVRRSALPGYIVEVLSERYPGRVVPHGTWKLLSGELGITPAYIGSVAARNGWEVEGHDQDRTTPLLAALKKRFPGRELPFGTFVALAEEFEVSPQYVRKAATQAGWTTSKDRPTKPSLLCQCGRPVRSEGATCRDCRWVEVACEQCGQPVRRRERGLLLRKRTGRYSGRIFCNRECFAAFRKGRPRGE